MAAWPGPEPCLGGRQNVMDGRRERKKRKQLRPICKAEVEEAPGAF